MSEHLPVLVLVQGYPSEADRYNLAYVHTRLLLYAAAGLQVRVLNFGARSSYRFEGIEVCCEADWQGARPGEILLSHAPNLRNHLRFLLRHAAAFRALVLFFHGHEVLLKAEHYPAPFAYDPGQRLHRRLLDQAYDRVKLRLWRSLLARWLPAGKLRLVFVSDWMRQAMQAGVEPDPWLLARYSEIIPNPVHPAFLAGQWQPASPRKADFITIRPLDNPKYGVDIVRQLAIEHPALRFEVYGRGRYFSHYPPPANLSWQDTWLDPEAMTGLLSQYGAALMPTRLDAQGVMMCELASFGMPVITSDLPVCREMLAGFPRCGYLSPGLDLAQELQRLSAAPAGADRSRFAPERTIGRELALIRSLAGPATADAGNMLA